MIAKVLLLAAGLLLVGGMLVILGLEGTFDTRTCPPPSCIDGSCTPPPPSTCFDQPDPWPGFLGSALWVTGLALAGGWYAQRWTSRAKAAKGLGASPAASEGSPEGAEEETPTPTGRAPARRWRRPAPMGSPGRRGRSAPGREGPDGPDPVAREHVASPPDEDGPDPP